ncbi:MAG: hypothetical protein ACT4OY_07575 [Alphaproteobacteria bacterium]
MIKIEQSKLHTIENPATEAGRRMNEFIAMAVAERFSIKLGYFCANEKTGGGFAVHKMPGDVFDFETTTAEEAINEMAYRQAVTREIILNGREYEANVRIFGEMGYKFGGARYVPNPPAGLPNVPDLSPAPDLV